MIVSKITRKYCFKGEMIQLVKDKEVNKEDYEKFSSDAKQKYFEVKTSKTDKKSDKLDN